MSEKAVTKALDKNMVKVEVELYEPFYNFIKEYLAFFGSKNTVEDFCRIAIYDAVKDLYNQLGCRVLKEREGTGEFLEEDAWFNKWMHIAICSTPDNPEDGKET